VADVEHSSKASLLRLLPMTLFTIDGTLRLKEHRLTFTRSRDRVVFDAPVGELHSISRGAGAALYLWHGSRRLRFITGQVYVHHLRTGSAVLDTVTGVGAMGRAFAADAVAKSVRDEWLELLVPLAGEPPPGVEVSRPWPTWAWAIAVVGATIVLLAVIVAVVLATA
jgi:hypothetical protein